MVTFVLSYVKFHTAAEEQLSPHELVENDITSKQASKQADSHALRRCLLRTFAAYTELILIKPGLEWRAPLAGSRPGAYDLREREKALEASQATLDLTTCTRRSTVVIVIGK